MKLLRYLVLTLLFWGLAVVGSAAPSIKYQVDKHYPPYTYANGDYLYGFDISLTTLVFDDNDYQIEYSADTWEDIYPRLVSGQIDVGGIIAVTEERKREVLFTEPLFNAYVAIYTPAKAPKVGLDDFKRLRVGVGKGYYTETLLRNTLGIQEYQAYTQMDEAVNDLLAGKIDVIFENQQLMDNIIIANNLKGAIIPQVTDLFPREHAYAVSKQRPELVEYMNRNIKRLKNNGLFEEVYVKFFYTHSDTYFKAQQQNHLYLAAVIALLVLGGAVLLKLYVAYLKKQVAVNYQQLMRAHQSLQAKEEELLAQNEELRAKEEELVAQNEELQAQEKELIDNYHKIRYNALHDSLTGLPNRAYLNEQLEALLQVTLETQAEEAGAVLFIDLDDLKSINDSLGHRYGDDLIIKSGELIAAELGEAGFLSRIGGDEFIAIVKEHNSRAAIGTIAERIIQKLAYEHEAAGIRLQTSASIGVALYPEHGDTADEILKNADNAMYAAKKAGKNCWRFYEPSMQAETYELVTLKAALRSALKRGELSLVHQPQVRVRDQRVVGFEALLRWKNPQHGMVSPALFIPLAEQTGFIHEIGEWVLHQACSFARALAADGCSYLHVGVNVSPVQLALESFVRVVENCIAEAGIRPEQLELEITETALMSSLENVARNLTALHALGVRLALDDFGTGYSSLTYLHRLPVDTLKIDKSFIDMILTNSNHTAIIGNIVDMAHSMEMSVVAEGVETAEQVAFLRKSRCDFIQGYYFGRPVPEDEVKKYL